MSYFKHTNEINLDIHRCYDCGRFWALEQGWPGDCPNCARRSQNEKLEESDAKDRTIAALRGALTKAKKTRR